MGSANSMVQQPHKKPDFIARSLLLVDIVESIASTSCKRDSAMGNACGTTEILGKCTDE